MLIEVYAAVHSKSLGRIVKDEIVDVPESECRNWLGKFALPVEVKPDELRGVQAPDHSGNAAGNDGEGHDDADVLPGARGLGERGTAKRTGTGTGKANRGGRDAQGDDSLSGDSDPEITS